MLTPLHPTNLVQFPHPRRAELSVLLRLPSDFSPIRSTFGVTGLVRFGSVPQGLTPGVIDEIKTREDGNHGIHVDRPQWQPGEMVEIVNGALSGLKGLFLASYSFILY